MDHCAEQDHGCAQLCLNTGDSFVCQCSEGFVINEDLKTCSRESPSHFSYRAKVFTTGVKNVTTAQDSGPPLSPALGTLEIVGVSPGDCVPSRCRTWGGGGGVV